MKNKIVDAAKKSTIVMLLSTLYMAFISVPVVALEVRNGWLMLLWVPVIGVVAFIWSLNPFKWFS